MNDHERKKFGILAFPAGHSLSPVMFEAAGVKYGVFEIPEEEFSDFMKARNFDGLSVSLPYKERVMEFLDEVSDDARKIGAVNTVVRSEDGLKGFNTDWIGAVEALREGMKDHSFDGKKIIVLGAGGAARAIVYGLLKEGASVTVLNRDLNEAQKLADDFGVEVGLLSSADGRECDVLIQATSVWLTAGLDVKIVPDSFVVELGAKGGLVMDIVYKPLMTPLLEVAKEAGCRIVTGEKMLLNQACEQFKIWFGKEAPSKEMGEALEP
jgi:shikimate dehydrogenase